MVFPLNALPSCQLVREGIDELLVKTHVKLEACRRYYEVVDADLLFFFSDIAIQAEAMGATVNFAKNTMPSVKKPASSIGMPFPSNVLRMKVNADVIRGLRLSFPDRMLSAMVYGPFTVAGQIAGEQKVLKGVVEKPSDVLVLLEKTLVVAQNYAQYLLDAGADLLWVSDPLAALLPPDNFWTFAGEFLSRLFDIYPSGPSMLHICGNIFQVIEEMVKTGVKGISFDQCMDLLFCEDVVPDNVGIIGNIDPVEIIELGSAEQVKSRVEDLVSVMGVKDNFNMSTGCAVPPSAPIENVVQFIETSKMCLSQLKPYAKVLAGIGDHVHRGERENLEVLIGLALEEGMDSLMVVNSGLMRAVRKGSARYNARQCYLPEILLMVDAFYQGYKMLAPHFMINGDKTPQVILGTVKGDFHEIGKDLVRIVLETNGVRVLDIGVDVSSERFIEAAKMHQVNIVGLSAFITSARKQLEQIVKSFQEKGLGDVSVIVGGAAVNRQIAMTIGAQGYAKNAVEAVKLVKDILKAGQG